MQHVWETMHCEPYQIAFQGGIIALVIALSGIGWTMVTTRYPVKATILGGLLVNSCGNFTLHYPVTALLFCLALFLPEPSDA